MLELLRRSWIVALGATQETYLLVDTKPISVLGLKRNKTRSEGVFHEIQNTGRNPERLLNKTVDGFCVHIVAKLASQTLRLLLKKQFDINESDRD